MGYVHERLTTDIILHATGRGEQELILGIGIPSGAAIWSGFDHVSGILNEVLNLTDALDSIYPQSPLRRNPRPHHEGLNARALMGSWWRISKGDWICGSFLTFVHASLRLDF